MNGVGSGPAAQWWVQPTGDPVREAAYTFASSLEQSAAETDRRSSFLIYASQYLQRPVTSLHDFAYSIGVTPMAPGGVGRSSASITRTLVDTALSRFARTETRVQLLTTGGDPGTRRQAEELTDAANALLQEAEAEREMRRAAAHACIFDIGPVKRIIGSDGKLSCEAIPPWEIMVDQADAHRGRPTIFVQRIACDKDAVVADFADGDEELADDIRASGSSDHLTAPDHTVSDQHVIVYELWRLPVGKRKGRHVVVTDRALLLDEECDRLPIVFITWDQAPIGWYPQSLAAIVSSLQTELDGVRQRISQSLRLNAVPRYVVQPAGDSTEQPPMQLAELRGGTDAIGDIIQLAPGAKLEAMPPPISVGAETFKYEADLWQRGFLLTGISEQSAQGQIPRGITAGIAITSYNDIQQDRLSLVALRYQKAHVDLAGLLLEAVTDLEDYQIPVKSKDGHFLRRVRASELKLGDADYVVQSWPVSALPSTPTGRLEAAAELLQVGGIDRDQFQTMVQLPDLKAELNINLAGKRAAEKLIERMIESGEYNAPPDTLAFDPQVAADALKYASSRHLDGISEDMADDRLQLLENWIDHLRSRIESATAPAGPAAPPGAPQTLNPPGNQTAPMGLAEPGPQLAVPPSPGMHA